MNKNLHIVDASIALVANSNNPSLLNPDFLKFNNIVPKDWRLAKPPLTTEPFSQVVYDNGFHITCQFQKIVFFCNNFEKNDLDKISQIANNYINTIPHVNYSAIGFNPTFFLPVEDPNSYLQQTFIKNGPWTNLGDGLASVHYKFFFSHKSFNCTLEIREGTFQDQKGIIFHTNLHHNLGHDKNIEAMKEKIAFYSVEIEDYKNMIFEKFIRDRE